jgi:ABC-type transporter MlaC component
MKKSVLIAAAFALTAFAAGCEQPKVDGAAEKAGEKLDNAMDDATKDHRDLRDGAAENMGETMDKGAGNKSAGDNN